MKRTVRNTLLKGGALVFSSAILVSLSYDSERPLTRLSMWIMMISYYALLTIVDAKMLADEAKEKDRKKYNKSLTIGAVIICVLGGIAGIYSLHSGYDGRGGCPCRYSNSPFISEKKPQR